jgi:four helix bundle protein
VRRIHDSDTGFDDLDTVGSSQSFSQKRPFKRSRNTEEDAHRELRFCHSNRERCCKKCVASKKPATPPNGLPKEFAHWQRYGLTSQLRRAAVSTATNIVEGCARDSNREHARFFEIAFGSAREVLYLVDVSMRLKMMDSDTATTVHELGRRTAAALAALRKTL